jgi:hypothetical protein
MSSLRDSAQSVSLAALQRRLAALAIGTHLHQDPHAAQQGKAEFFVQTAIPEWLTDAPIAIPGAIGVFARMVASL